MGMKELNTFRKFLNENNDLGFDVQIETLPNKPGVLLHELVTLGTFSTPDKEDIELKPYHLIFGENSLAIFDVFDTDEIAGLSREDAEKHIANMEASGKTEQDDAFLGGLTNFYGDQIFEFINVARASSPGYINRILPHESLHLTRYLISLSENEWVLNNLDKENWWEDERAKMANLVDENEELFAEVLERTTAIARAGWDKITK